jgi:23S rRNA (uracil1939-C5)-methyltransferase
LLQKPIKENVTPMKTSNNSPEFEVAIEKWANNGCGMGTFHSANDGGDYVIEVPFTAPGDKVKARVIRERREYYSCELVKINRPSSERIEAKCKHFASCGGCQLQHITYEQELANKEQIVRSSFASILNESVTFHPIMPSPSHWGYRNKMDYTFTQNERKEKFLGLMMHFGKCKVFNISECPIGSDWFIEAVKAVKHWWENTPLEAYHAYKNIGNLCNLSVREGLRSGDRLVILTVRGENKEPIKKGLLHALVEALKKKIAPEAPGSTLSVILRVEEAARGTTTNFYEHLLYGPRVIREILHIQPSGSGPEKKLTFQMSPTAAFQPNTLQAEKLYSRIKEIAEIGPEATIYDFYCGTGILGICFASYVKQAFSIGISPEATADTRANIALNNIDNITVITSAIRHILQPSVNACPLPSEPDLLLITSPGPGPDDQTLQAVIKLKPKKIIYIACNLDIQAKNISFLIDAGYRLACIQPIDIFPQTVRLENIAMLIRD